MLPSQNRRLLMKNLILRKLLLPSKDKVTSIHLQHRVTRLPVSLRHRQCSTNEQMMMALRIIKMKIDSCKFRRAITTLKIFAIAQPGGELSYVAGFLTTRGRTMEVEASNRDDTRSVK